jgi:hypothetical protein
LLFLVGEACLHLGHPCPQRRQFFRARGPVELVERRLGAFEHRPAHGQFGIRLAIVQSEQRQPRPHQVPDFHVHLHDDSRQVRADGDILRLRFDDARTGELFGEWRLRRLDGRHGRRGLLLRRDHLFQRECERDDAQERKDVASEHGNISGLWVTRSASDRKAS